MAKDYPLQEIIETCRDLIDNKGATIWQKWTCGGCGARCTANNANTITEKCHCEHCDFVTDITKTGCNYRLAMPIFGDKQQTQH